MGARRDALDDRVGRAGHKKVKRVKLRTVFYVCSVLRRGVFPSVNERPERNVAIGANKMKACWRGERQLAILLGVVLYGEKARDQHHKMQRDEGTEQRDVS